MVKSSETLGDPCLKNQRPRLYCFRKTRARDLRRVKISEKNERNYRKLTVLNRLNVLVISAANRNNAFNCELHALSHKIQLRE